MNAYWIGTIVGAAIFGFFWSRLWLWITKRFNRVPGRFFVAYGLAWLSAMPLGAAGFADGGPMDWSRSFVSYTPALLLWFIIDLLRGKHASARP